MAIVALCLPWLFGIAALWFVAGFFPAQLPGLPFRMIGAGACLGFISLTLLMRVYSALGVVFSFTALAFPLFVATIIFAVIVIQRIRRTGFSCPVCTLRALGLSARIIFILLLLLLSFRFVLLWLEVSAQPLFPWEAMLQSGAQAHVLFVQGKIVPFVDTQTWLTQPDHALYFSTLPTLPSTLPLLQAWMAYGVGEWNDTLINLPWWALLAALGFGVYGFVRQRAGVLMSLLAAWLATSLPLLNVHVALAGLPDLPLAVFYTLAALALASWANEKNPFDALLFVVLTLSAGLLWQASYLWLITLLIAVPFVFIPKWRGRSAAGLLAAIVLIMLLLPQFGQLISPQLAGIVFMPDESAQQWISLLIEGKNWHVAWIAVLAVTVFGWRQWFNDTCSSVLTVLVLTAALACAATIGFPQLGTLIVGSVHAGRIVLIMMPLLMVWCVWIWAEQNTPVSFIESETHHKSARS